MILPSRTVKPVDSLFVIAAEIVGVVGKSKQHIDDTYSKLLEVYPKKVELEKFLLALNYLFITGKLEYQNEIIEIKFD